MISSVRSGKCRSPYRDYANLDYYSVTTKILQKNIDLLLHPITLKEIVVTMFHIVLKELNRNI